MRGSITGRRSSAPNLQWVEEGDQMASQPPRILLVDDEESVQKLLAYPLRKEGYEVVPARDGEEALERFNDDAFDLIVLDVMLPKRDGFDVCRRLRARSRVKAALRRVELVRERDRDGAGEPLELGDLRIDFGKRAVTVRGEPVRLTYVEFEIIATLARNPGRVFSRAALLEGLWGDSAYRDPRTVDVHIRHLREKVEREPREPEYIFTVRGVGYHFRDAS